MLFFPFISFLRVACLRRSFSLLILLICPLATFASFSFAFAEASVLPDVLPENLFKVLAREVLLASPHAPRKPFFAPSAIFPEFFSMVPATTLPIMLPITP